MHECDGRFLTWCFKNPDLSAGGLEIQREDQGAGEEFLLLPVSLAVEEKSQVKMLFYFLCGMM